MILPKIDFGIVTVESIIFSLIYFFVCMLIMNIPTSLGNNKLSFLINALILTCVFYFVSKYIPIAIGVQMIIYIIAIIINFFTSFFLSATETSNKRKPTGENGVVPFVLKTNTGNLIFNNPFRNFMVIGGANAGKTASIGKPLLDNYIQNNFAGFIYDLKDFDYTRSVYNLVQKHEYPYKFYYINFVDMDKTYRTNIIDPKLIDENLMLQLMSDVLSANLGDGQKNEWFINGLGIFKGVAMRFYYDFPQYCNLPTIVNFCVHNDAKRITEFVKARPESTALASAFIASSDSIKTQASILSSLNGYISDLAFNKKICYVLSGNDFDFNVIDPANPKMIAVSNNFGMQDVIGPVVALMVKVLSRHFTLNNKINTVFCMDEGTTFKIDGFENMPSVLREYKASFLLLTQSTAKIEKVYGKFDKASLQANFGNVFYGAISETNDIKDFSILFTKKKERKETRSKGSSGNKGSRSTAVSHQEKERYDPSFFKQLKAGEFVGVTSDANKSEFHVRFKPYEYKEEEKNISLPTIHNVSQEDLNKHYSSLITLVKNL